MALREADRLIFDEMNAEIGFLLCLPHLVPFYSQPLWSVVEDRHRGFSCARHAARYDRLYQSCAWPNNLSLRAPREIIVLTCKVAKESLA